MRMGRSAVLALVSALGLVACSSEEGGGGVGNTLNLAGGAATGTTGGGGEGGYVYIETHSPGGVKLKRAGAADTSFTVPSVSPSLDLGPNGVTVTSSLTVPVLAAGDPDPGDGVLYMIPEETLLFSGDGAGTVPDYAELVTGLSVAAGATVTLGLNHDTDGNGGGDAAGIGVDGDVEIAGTLKAAPLSSVTVNTDLRHGAAATARDAGAIAVVAGQLFVRNGGKIDARGGDAAAGSDERGGDGGLIVIGTNFFGNDGTLDASGGDGDGAGVGGQAAVSSGAGNQFVLMASGMVLNRGVVLADGGQGADGGAAADVFAEAGSFIYNTGAIRANGGAGSAGTGGPGAHVALESEDAGVFNSGAIAAAGGNGGSGGGSAGSVVLFAGSDGWAGDVVNPGTIDVSGGAATTGGDGGYAGSVYLEAYGGVRTSGALTLDGGAGKGASSSGGSGGYLYVGGYAPYDWYYGYYLPTRPVQISANLSLVGGAAEEGYGGQGGEVYVYQENSQSAESEAGIELLGYSSAELSGGDGPEYGGDADGYSLEVYTYAGLKSSGGYAPAGSIENELDVVARGGDATGADGEGGDGAYSGLYLQVSNWDLNVPGKGLIRNSGNLDFSGGSSTGSQTGGDSGGFELYAPGDVTNTGRVLNRGGDAEDGYGGEGNDSECRLISGANVVNSGDIISDGGAGASGGPASDDWTEMYAGGQVRNSGKLSANGGAATDAGAGTSGDGGYIDLFSETKATQNTGALSVAAGSGGATQGEAGEVWIDWVLITPGTISFDL